MSYLFCTSVLFVSCMYLDGGMGGGGWLLTSFFSIIYILGLVCYKHTIHEGATNFCVAKQLLNEILEHHESNSTTSED